MKFVDHLLARVAEALMKVSTEDRVFLETQLLLLVERFAPLRPEDSTEEQIDDELDYPHPEDYLRRLMERSREPDEASSPFDDEEDLYDVVERYERRARRRPHPPSAPVTPGAPDAPESSEG